MRAHEILYFTLLSIAGSLVRVFTTYWGYFFVEGVVWVNIFCCFTIGLTTNARPLRELYPRATQLFEVAFLGCLSSFSALFLNTSYSFVTGQQLFALPFLFVSFAAFFVFHAFGRLVGRQWRMPPRRTDARAFLATASLFGVAAAVVLTVTLIPRNPLPELVAEITPAQRAWSVAALFALPPVGAATRYNAMKLNQRAPGGEWHFFVGTYVANAFGFLCAAVLVAMASQADDAERLFLMTTFVSFTGCVTTLSTFIKELFDMYAPWSVLYFSASVASGFVIVVTVFAAVGVEEI